VVVPVVVPVMVPVPPVAVVVAMVVMPMPVMMPVASTAAPRAAAPRTTDGHKRPIGRRGLAGRRRAGAQRSQHGQGEGQDQSLHVVTTPFGYISRRGPAWTGRPCILMYTRIGAV
jgi:hypothetical protein